MNLDAGTVEGAGLCVVLAGVIQTEAAPGSKAGDFCCISCGWLNSGLLSRSRSDRVAGAYREVKSSNNSIRFQRTESPPSENRGERGVLSRVIFREYWERLASPRSSGAPRHAHYPDIRGGRVQLLLHGQHRPRCLVHPAPRFPGSG